MNTADRKAQAAHNESVMAASTHTRIDWSNPLGNKNVNEHDPILVLRSTDGKWVAVEGITASGIAEPITLIQHMGSMDLKRKCLVWAIWNGEKQAGFWDMVPARMPLYKVHIVETEDEPAKLTGPDSCA